MRWRVPGLHPDVRKIAQDAAEAAGLPVGPWLDRAIRARLDAEALPAPRLELKRRSHPAGRAFALDRGASQTPQLGLDLAQREATHTPGVEAALSAPDPAVADPSADVTRPATESRSATATVPNQTRPAFASEIAARFCAAMLRATRGMANRRALVLSVLLLSMLAAGSLWWLDSRKPAGPLDAPQATAPGEPAPAPGSLAQLQRDALAGDPMAQHDLALAYVNGRGVPQNYETAALWFEKAALAGLERAQFNLAMLYENALGVPEDLQRAFALYSAAAEQGFGPAQHNTAVAYAEGRGTTRDYRAALLWFRRAADQGIVSSQFNLGMIYEKGLAGPPDEQTAYQWYRRAAAGGSQSAVARLAAIEGRIAPPAAQSNDAAKGKTAKPTRAEIAEIQRLLGQLSFKAGTPDGKVGPATRDAIRQYERVAALPVTGEPSVALLAHLRQVTGMMDANR